MQEGEERTNAEKRRGGVEETWDGWGKGYEGTREGTRTGGQEGRRE